VVAVVVVAVVAGVGHFETAAGSLKQVAVAAAVVEGNRS
jgi:hypothetical protein